MRRKIVLSVILLIMSIGLMACKTTETVEPTEVGYAVVEEEQVNDTVSESVSETESGWTMPEIESAQIESEISWYMDEEGVKNEELGISIKRDNGILDLELDWNLYLHDAGSSQATYASCFYYDGDFETYISENELQKDSINGVEYAYKDEIVFGRDIFIGGNGIIVRVNINDDILSEGETYNDYLSRMNIIKTCDEFSLDCLAYFSEDGFYCPASGFSFSIADTEHSMGEAALSCENKEYNAFMQLIDHKAFHGIGNDAHRVSAQEEVDEHIDSMLKPDEYETREITAIEQSAEYDIGKGHYYGRGVNIVSDTDDIESWYFRSDNTSWTIECRYNRQDGLDYKNFLEVFEVLEK